MIYVFQSPGSDSGDSAKKVRRKLPAIPAGVEPVQIARRGKAKGPTPAGRVDRKPAGRGDSKAKTAARDTKPQRTASTDTTPSRAAATKSKPATKADTKTTPSTTVKQRAKPSSASRGEPAGEESKPEMARRGSVKDIIADFERCGAEESEYVTDTVKRAPKKTATANAVNNAKANSSPAKATPKSTTKAPAPKPPAPTPPGQKANGQKSAPPVPPKPAKKPAPPPPAKAKSNANDTAKTTAARPATTGRQTGTVKRSDSTDSTHRKTKAKAAPAPPAKKEPETVNIRGVEVPVEIRSMKKRLKEEIQIVTATRRLHIDEQEEIRRMERELEEREKERRLRMEQQYREEAERKRLEAEAKAKLEKEKEKQMRRKMTPPAATITSRMSPQQSPRRGRHKRQNSDPIIAKFSPIEEMRDFESDIHSRLGLQTATLASHIAETLNARTLFHRRRSGTVTPPSYADFSDLYAGHSGMAQSYRSRPLSRSTDMLSMTDRMDIDYLLEPSLHPSHSEASIPLSFLSRSRSPSYFADMEEDRRRKEQKRKILQMEILKRKKQLQENARLQQELRRMKELGDVSRQDFDDLRRQYQRYVKSRERLTRSTENIPTGIIRPIDYDFSDMDQYSKAEYLAYRDLLERGIGTLRERYFPQPSYSSMEYLAHRERSSRSDLDDPLAGYDTGYVLQDEYMAEQPRSRYAKMDDMGMSYPPGNGEPILAFTGASYPERLESGMLMASSLGGPIRAKSDADLLSHHHYDAYCDLSPLPTETTETTPPSDSTPAMPILEEVTKKSRSLLRDIGSRPLSDDMDKYFQAEGIVSSSFTGCGGSRPLCLCYYVFFLVFL